MSGAATHGVMIRGVARVPASCVPRRLTGVGVVVAVGVVAFGLTALAAAQERVSVYDGQSVQRARPTTAAAAAGGLNFQRLMLAMLLVMLLIVALRYAAGWLFPGTRAGVSHRGVRVLGRTAIAPRQQVVLLHVGRRVLVVGDSAGRLSPLADIADPDEVAELLGQAGGDEPSPPAARFRSLFGSAKNEFDEPSGGARGMVVRGNRNLEDDSGGDPSGDASGDAGLDVDDAPPDPNVAAAQEEISGLLDRMRSLTKTVRRP